MNITAHAEAVQHLQQWLGKEFAGNEVRAEVSTAFGSQQPQHRLALRQAIAASLALTPTESSEIFDLSMPPRLDGFAISVSHAPGLGGFVAGRSHLSIGFDLEDRQRIQPAVLERICTSAERAVLSDLQAAGLGAWLWVAKEASIKAAGNHRPPQAPLYNEVAIESFDTATGAFSARTAGIAIRGRSVMVETPSGSWCSAIAVAADAGAENEFDSEN